MEGGACKCLYVGDANKQGRVQSSEEMMVPVLTPASSDLRGGDREPLFLRISSHTCLSFCHKDDMQPSELLK